MHLGKALLYLYPDAETPRDYVVKNDGNGEYIAVWNLPNPIPSNEELRQAYIEYLKKERIEYFDNYCEELILRGFTSATTGHFYRFNIYDQMNFNQAYNRLMYDNSITEIAWKTEDAGILIHSREDWIKVYHEGGEHKWYTINHYWQIKNQILNATTEEEILSIQW